MIVIISSSDITRLIHEKIKTQICQLGVRKECKGDNIRYVFYDLCDHENKVFVSNEAMIKEAEGYIENKLGVKARFIDNEGDAYEFRIIV